MDEKSIIGRAEHVDFPDLGLKAVPAKVDTGADISSIWVSEVTETPNGLLVVFFGPGSECFTGKPVLFNRYTVTRVANSFGHREMRYKIKLRVRVGGRLVKATFTLSNRSLKMYPILLGRRLLNGKFLVDVSLGTPLKDFEVARAQKLKAELESLSKPGEII